MFLCYKLPLSWIFLFAVMCFFVSSLLLSLLIAFFLLLFQSKFFLPVFLCFHFLLLTHFLCWQPEAFIQSEMFNNDTEQLCNISYFISYLWSDFFINYLSTTIYYPLSTLKLCPLLTLARQTSSYLQFTMQKQYNNYCLWLDLNRGPYIQKAGALTIELRRLLTLARQTSSYIHFAMQNNILFIVSTQVWTQVPNAGALAIELRHFPD